jgi:hypothetical protein
MSFLKGDGMLFAWEAYCTAQEAYCTGGLLLFDRGLLTGGILHGMLFDRNLFVGGNLTPGAFDWGLQNSRRLIQFRGAIVIEPNSNL